MIGSGYYWYLANRNTNTNIYKILNIEVTDSSRNSYFYDLSEEPGSMKPMPLR